MAMMARAMDRATPSGRDAARSRWSATGPLIAVCCLVVSTMVAVAPAAAADGDDWQTGADAIWDVTNPDPGSRHIAQVRALVRDMQEHNGRMYVAGKFLEVKAPDGTTRDQPYLAAFDVETGDWIESFRPDVGGIVMAIEITPDGRLYASGEMPGGIELFDAETGAQDNRFQPGIDLSWGPPAVYDIELSGGLLYAGGNFSEAQGTPLANLARLDPATGALDQTWLPTTQFDSVTPRLGGRNVFGLAVDDARNRVYLAGKFGGVNGNTDAAYFATLDTADGELVAGLPQGLPAGIPNHRTSFSMWMMDVQFRGDQVYVGGQGHQTMTLDAGDLAVQSTFFTNRGVGDQYAGGDTQVIFVGEEVVWSGCHCWGSVGPFELGSYINAADGVMVYEEYREWVVDFRDVNPFGQQKVNGGFGIDIASGELLDLTFDIRGQSGAYAIVEDSNGRLWFGGQYLSDGATGRQLEGIVRFSRTDEPPVSPPAPTGLTSTLQTRERVVLRWDRVAGASSYEITRDGEAAGSSTGRWFTARDLDAGTTYDFTVAAIFPDGSRSLPTTPLSVSTIGDVVEAPTGLTSTLQTRERIVVRWDRVAGAAGYEVVQDGVVVAEQTGRWFTARDLDAGTTYEFTVRSVFPDGRRSSDADPIEVSTLP